MSRLILIGMAWLAAICDLNTSAASAAGWGREYVPNVPVVTQDGQVVRFYDDLIRDKIVVISFIYTTCKDICPLATARLSEARDRLGDRLGRDIFFYSLSIEPEHDTPERLKQYADAFQAGPGWLFLTGLPEDIKAIRHKFGDRRPDLADHRNDVVLGNGATGEWQRENSLGDIEHFVEAIRAMDPKWRRGPRTVLANDAAANQTTPAKALPKSLPYDTGFIMEGRQAGSAMFAKLCAGCHTVGRGERVGPDLEGLTLRRSRAWITDFLMDPIKMRAKKDPIALALVAKYPGVRMPYLKINESDVTDLISYIDAHSSQRAPTIALEPLYTLTTQDGGHLTPADLKGRPFGVVFGYTHCPDVCPTTLLEWSNVIESLGQDRQGLKLLFISVDPARDTPQELKSYMEAFNVGITALTGSQSQIAAAVALFDAYYERIPGNGGQFTYDHTVKTYMVDREQHLFGTLDLHSEPSTRRRMLAQLLAY